VGGHVFGKVYTGGIGTILTAWFDELKKSEEIQSLCIQCGNCKEVCPAKIDIPQLILEIRRRLAKDEGQSLAQKAIFSVVNNRRLFHSVLRAASVAQGPFSKDGLIRHLPLFLSGMTEFRSLPAIAGTPFRDRFKVMEQFDPATRGERAVFFAGCLIDFAYPEMGEAVVRILKKAGVEVIFPDGQTCCGAPARYSGAYEVAGQNAADNIAALLKEDAEYIVSACGTCTAALKYEFTNTLESLGKTELLLQARKVAARAIDFSTLIKKLVDEGRLAFKTVKDAVKFTYHDSCHLKRTLGVHDEPRELLKSTGMLLVEMFESDMCCGMGGSYSLKMPEISAPILERKLKNIKATAASIVAMDCPGCVMQIRGGFDKEGSSVRVVHTAELLERQIS